MKRNSEIENFSFTYKINVYWCFYVAIYQVWKTMWFNYRKTNNKCSYCKKCKHEKQKEWDLKYKHKVRKQSV